MVLIVLLRDLDFPESIGFPSIRGEEPDWTQTTDTQGGFDEA